MGETKYNDYSGFARAYAHSSETKSFNALYERPAILALAGDVRGLRVLDAGCGPGLHAAELIERGAAVTGIDLSQELLDLARDRVGPSVPLRRADLAQPLDFADDSFDMVMSSLVMHYLRDWGPTLREFRRVLVPGGRLVMSTHHPFMGLRIGRTDDYFATYTFTEDWQRGGRTMHMRFWHRPLRDMFRAFRAAGFTVDVIEEPDPLPEMATADPSGHEHLTRLPQFVFFVLR
ncbi:class I SAM-dependent methyltransferase [Actinocrispum wychmicini]|uniref:Methyltransferase family protein n=1 Tax=Actinocrispum wychmicini TaxID=1213861 RepID=A0A4V2S4N9_9PSEU|nr:methyltransferase domain-containing protein [Actinocrispum wychmicini]TCO48950.1 methyltransferase family protein [Actinocrispum wychmicini]